jgi:hypothetical protein
VVIMRHPHEASSDKRVSATKVKIPIGPALGLLVYVSFCDPTSGTDRQLEGKRGARKAIDIQDKPPGNQEATKSRSRSRASQTVSQARNRNHLQKSDKGRGLNKRPTEGQIAVRGRGKEEIFGVFRGPSAWKLQKVMLEDNLVIIRKRIDRIHQLQPPTFHIWQAWQAVL